jgi:hypothetical protein
METEPRKTKIGGTPGINELEEIADNKWTAARVVLSLAASVYSGVAVRSTLHLYVAVIRAV